MEGVEDYQLKKDRNYGFIIKKEGFKDRERLKMKRICKGALLNRIVRAKSLQFSWLRDKTSSLPALSKLLKQASSV